MMKILELLHRQCETMKVAHSWTLKVLHSKHPVEVIFVDESCRDLLSQPLAPLCWLLVIEGEQLYHFRQAGAKQCKNLWWFLTGKTQLIRCLLYFYAFLYHYWTHLFNLQVPVRKPSCQPQPPQDDQEAHPSNALPSKGAHEERFLGWNDLLACFPIFPRVLPTKQKLKSDWFAGIDWQPASDIAPLHLNPNRWVLHLCHRWCNKSCSANECET